MLCADPVVRVRVTHVLCQAAAAPGYQGCTALISGGCKHAETAGAMAGTCMCQPLHVKAIVWVQAGHHALQGQHWHRLKIQPSA